MGLNYEPMTEQEGAAFWERVVDDCASGCLVWVGRKNSYGYGVVGKGRRQYLAHRMAWTSWRGPIPSGLCIDHLCRVRSCQNVAHMEVVTKSVNTMRGMSAQAVNARKTACKRGHALAGSNLVIERGKSGRPLRRCRWCRNQYAKAWQMAKRNARMVNTQEDLDHMRALFGPSSVPRPNP